MNPARACQRFQHIYALFFYALFSLDYVFVRDFECFFFPTHEYLKRTQASGARIRNSLCREGVLPHLHAGFAGGGAGQIAAAGRWAFLLVHLIVGLDRIAGLPDHAYRRQHILSRRAAASLTTACITSSRRQPIMRRATRWWAGLTGGLNHHIAHHLCPFVCHTHYAPLTRIVKQTAEEFGVPYRQHPTMTRAIWHHLILLKQLGNED